MWTSLKVRAEPAIGYADASMLKLNSIKYSFEWMILYSELPYDFMYTKEIKCGTVIIFRYK